MAIKILDKCTDCGACESQCPNTVIFEEGIKWSWKDGAGLSGKVILADGTEVNAEDLQESVSSDEAEIEWCWQYGTELSGKVVFPDGTEVDPEDLREPDLEIVHSRFLML